MDYSVGATFDPSGALSTGLLAFTGGIMVFAIIIGLVIYIYYALALTKIAARTNTANGWYAWVPILNVYLMIQIGKVPAWTLVLILVPGVNVVAGIYWLWKMFEALKRPGWWAILSLISPINLILLGIAAWGAEPKA